MNPKQLNQLFMKIDADSNGSVGNNYIYLFIHISRVAWIYELYVTWKPNTFFYESWAFRIREGEQARPPS